MPKPNVSAIFRRILGPKASDGAEQQLEAAVRAVVAEAIAGAEQLPDQAARDLVPEDERRAVGAEYQRRQAELLSAREAAREKIEAIDRERAALEERAQAAYGAQLDVEASHADSFKRWRDEVGRRLWEGRPALVDRLVARLRAEAITRPDQYHRPLSMVQGRLENEVSISNEPSCGQRTRALIQLAEKVEAWTRTGAYATEAELRDMYERAYREIPRIASIESHVRDVPGESERRARMFRRNPPEPFSGLPPAA